MPSSHEQLFEEDIENKTLSGMSAKLASPGYEQLVEGSWYKQLVGFVFKQSVISSTIPMVSRGDRDGD